MSRTVFVAGADGGGTRTTVVCSTAGGKTLDSRVFGPFNLNGTGEEAFRGVLHEILGYLQSLGECRALCIGASGLDNVRMREIVSDVFSSSGITLKLVADYETALAGALDGKEGIAVIAGTGSVCFGYSREKGYVRSGGWGHLIGDRGSGYALGLDALVAVTGEIDGTAQHTLLSDMLCEKYGLKDQNSIVSYVYGKDKSAVAELSCLVDKACTEGDEVAMRIVRDNAKALVSDVMSVHRRSGLGKCCVALMGGLLEHDTCLRREFVRILKTEDPGLSCTEPGHSAAQGAVMLAMGI